MGDNQAEKKTEIACCRAPQRTPHLIYEPFKHSKELSAITSMSTHDFDILFLSKFPRHVSISNTLYCQRKHRISTARCESFTAIISMSPLLFVTIQFHAARHCSNRILMFCVLPLTLLAVCSARDFRFSLPCLALCVCDKIICL